MAILSELPRWMSPSDREEFEYLYKEIFKVPYDEPKIGYYPRKLMKTYEISRSTLLCVFILLKEYEKQQSMKIDGK